MFFEVFVGEPARGNFQHFDECYSIVTCSMCMRGSNAGDREYDDSRLMLRVKDWNYCERTYDEGDDASDVLVLQFECRAQRRFLPRDAFDICRLRRAFVAAPFAT